MKRIQFAVALLAACAGFTHGQVVTAPVGFVSVTVPAASDAALGAPLSRAEEFQGVIQSITGNTITVAGTPGWTANQFVYASGTQPKTYYARIDSGTKEGLIATIASNGTGSVTLTLPSGEDLTNISTNAALVSPATTGDSISIAPYWTPASLITGVVAGTQLLRFSASTAGINLPSSSVYVFSGTNWMQGVSVVNDVTFGSFEGFVLRNNSASPQTISITGSVPMTGVRSKLYTLAANTSQDQRLFYNSPIPESIGNVFPPTSLAAGDRLLVFDNAASGKNKGASAVLVWTGSAWMQGVTNVTTTFQLQPGTSYVLRKNQTSSPSSVVWSDLQGYLQ
jgi:uncharacterized protein (TIGR02597 family)